MLENKDIIIISTMDWDESVQIMHQMALRLSEKNRVLYIGRQFSIEHLIKYPAYFRFVIKSFKGIYKIKENLWGKAPFLLKPARYYLRFMDNISQLMMRLRIKRWSKKLGFKNPIIWCFFPNSGNLVGKLNESLFFYHCVDCFSANSTGRKKKIIDQIEYDLGKKSDLIICTSKKIYGAKKELNQNTFYIPNAAETDLFLKVNSDEIKVNEDIEKIPGKKFLHLGYLNAKTNLKILFEIFSRHPEWSFIQIGEIMKKDFKKKELEDFLNLQNVFSLGFIEQKELPAYIKGCDACLIPLNKNEWTDCVSPLKFFEYAATGKIIISTNIDEIMQYPENAFIATNPSEFELLMEKVFKGEIAANPEAQLEFARNNTWDKRFEEIQKLVENNLK